MKSQPKSPKQKQQGQPQPEPSLQDKAALAQASQQKWSQLAADPSLSPQAAQAAKNLARSYAAAQRLGDKALAYQSPNADQQAEQDPMLTRLLQLPLGSSSQENPSSSTKPGTSA